MKQTTYMCPVCQNNEKPLKKTSMSRHRCSICERSFYNKELIGFEINRTDFVQYWRDRREALNPQISYPVVDGIKIEKDKDVYIQMDKMVQESTDNLMHEIIMVRIFDKELKEAEKTILKDEEQAIKSEIGIVKSEIDKIFDIILGRG